MAKQGEKIKLISAFAKKIRKEGEKWTDAIKRATNELKKLKKI
jgi:cell division protein ZapA (FtsZ GTPase activity inhibitor)